MAASESDSPSSDSEGPVPSTVSMGRVEHALSAAREGVAAARRAGLNEQVTVDASCEVEGVSVTFKVKVPPAVAQHVLTEEGKSSPTSNVRSPRTKVLDMLTAAIEGSALVLAMRVGIVTGLLPALLGCSDPVAPQMLADRTGHHPTYVLQWLRSLVAGGIGCWTCAGEFHLIPGAAAALGSSFVQAGVSVSCLMAKLVVDETPELFTSGGGANLANIIELQEAASRFLAAELRPHLLSRLLPAVPIQRSMLISGCSVVELGCGLGTMLQVLARAFPLSKFTGLDLSTLQIAKANALNSGLISDEIASTEPCTNLHYVAGDAQGLDSTTFPEESTDMVLMFDSLYFISHPAMALAEAHRILKPRGTLMVLELAGSSSSSEYQDPIPLAQLRSAMNMLYCAPVARGGLEHAPAPVSAEADEIPQSYWFSDVETTTRLISGSGFSVTRVPTPWLPYRALYVATKSTAVSGVDTSPISSAPSTPMVAAAATTERSS